MNIIVTKMQKIKTFSTGCLWFHPFCSIWQMSKCNMCIFGSHL